jgi:hypothetical protein
MKQLSSIQLMTIKTIVLVLLIFLTACTSEQKLTKEQILRQSIAEIESRFEERKLGRIVEYVSADYGDEAGRKLQDIKRAIQMQLMRHRSLHVFSTIKDIKWIDDNHATVNIVAAMAGKPIDSVSILTSIRADMINFTVTFVREDVIFKIQSAAWEWAEPSDFL